MASDPLVDNTAVTDICESLKMFPEKWRMSREIGSLSDGYRFISLDGEQYGMGQAKYQSTKPQRDDFLSPAIEAWKAWAIREVAPISSMRVNPLDAIPKKQGLEAPEIRFIESVMRAYSAYKSHMDAVVFVNSVGAAIGEHEAAQKLMLSMK